MNTRRWALALSLLLGACASEEPEDPGLTSDTGLALLASGPDEPELTEDLPRIEPFRLASPGSAGRTDSAAGAGSTTSTSAGSTAGGGSGPSARAAGPGGGGPRSRWVRWNSGGALDYDRDGEGDRVPDFSHAGYGGGGVALPRVDAVVRLSPSQGDDTRRIQAALDEVGRRPLDARGFRGAVELRAGRFQVSDTLRIDRSGVVLRGAGDRRGGTVLLDTRTRGGQSTKPATLMIAGRGGVDRDRRSEQRVTDRYVAVGTSRVRVGRARDFRPGDRVSVSRRWTAEWIDRIGMDSCSGRGTRFDLSDRPFYTCVPGGDEWRPGRETNLEREVRDVDGDELVLDAPLTDAVDADFGGATVTRYEIPNRITQVGVEHLRGDSVHRNSTDEDHAWHFVEVRDAEDVWVRDVTAEHFARSAVVLGNGARRATVQDSAYVNPISQISGGRRYAFDIDGAQFVLVQRCRADHARHAFVTGSVTMGPNVFLQCEATRSYTSSEMHSDWSTGLLYDRVREHEIQIHNENRSSEGHGWGGANSVLWNVAADVLRVSSPPTAQNWVIGARYGNRGGDAYWDEPGHAVEPGSLYLAQLRDRLGQGAVDNVTR